MGNQRFKSVGTLSKTHRRHANIKARNDLMYTITNYIRSCGMPHAEVSKIMGVTQPRISELMRCKVGRFTIDKLYEILVAIIANEVCMSAKDISGLKVGSGRTNTIAGASGYKHQIDVSLQDSNRIFIIECKRWNKKVGVQEVLILASRAKDISDCNPGKLVKAILASTQEVTENAMNIAEYFNIAIEIIESVTKFGIRIGPLIHVGVQSNAVMGSKAEAEIVKARL